MDIIAQLSAPQAGTVSPAAAGQNTPSAGEGFARSLEQAGARQQPNDTGTPAATEPAAPAPAAQLSAPQSPVASTTTLTAWSTVLQTSPATNKELLGAHQMPRLPAAGGLSLAAPFDITADTGLAALRERLALIESAGQLPSENDASLVNNALAAGGPMLPVPIQSTLPTAPDTLPQVATQAIASAPQAISPRSPLQATHAQQVDATQTADEAPSAPLLLQAQPQATSAPSIQTAALSQVAGDASIAHGDLNETFAPLARTEGAPLLSQPTQGSTTGTPTASATLSAPVASPEWQQSLGQQLIGLHRRGEQQIELHLNPAELGPLQVSLKLGELGAQAHFLSAHPQVRSAIEQAIPQLREALAEQGISLGEASVSEQRQRQADGERNNPGSGGHNSSLAQTETHEESAHAPALTTTSLRALSGGIDLYA